MTAAEDTQKVDVPQKEEEAVFHQCPSCGAQLMTTGTTAATYCYYCHNPVTVGGRFLASGSRI